MARTKRYPGSLERRGDGFRARFCIAGERHYVQLDTKNRREAERLAADEYAALEKRARRQAAGLPGVRRMAELLDEFEQQRLPGMAPNTRRSYADSLKPIREFFVERLQDPMLDEIQAAHVQRFLDWRAANRLNGDRPVSARTVAKDRAVLHRIFAIAEKLEYRDGNPVKRVDPPKSDGRQPVILSDAQFEALLAACAKRPMLELYVLTLAETGARAESEALQLRWEDVDLEGGFIQIVSGRGGHRTKSGKSRWTPMTPRLLRAMKEHFARFRFASYGGVAAPWVFHHPTTRRHHKAGQRIGTLYDAFKGAAKRAKLPPELVQHDLRHRRVTTWLAEGRDVVHVKEAVGHADLRTTMGYTHLAREHLRSLVEPPRARASGVEESA